jgi:hypothetical protein
MAAQKIPCRNTGVSIRCSLALLSASPMRASQEPAACFAQRRGPGLKKRVKSLAKQQRRSAGREHQIL